MPTSITVSRDPSEYRPTIHAGQRAKERGINWDRVADAIDGGEVRQTHRRGCRLFVDDGVGVVVDVADREILTVGWYE